MPWCLAAGVSATRRNDGRYALAISGRARVDATPQFMRFAPQFVPMFAKRWRNLLPGGLEGIRGGHETLARWRLDAPTPMERVRILDPKPDLPTIRETHRRAVELLPQLRDAKITHAWAGYHRQHAGRRSRHRRGAGRAGLHPGRGLFRARLRHRPWRRPPDRGPCHRRRTDRRSRAVSAGAVQRLGMGQGR